MERFLPGRLEEAASSRPGVGAAETGDPDSERALWRLFAEAKSPKAFCQAWLRLQCARVRGVKCALVLLGPPDRGPFVPVAVWPDAKLAMDHLAVPARQAVKERRGLLLEVDSAADLRFHVVYPIEIAGRIHGVVVLEVEHTPRHELQGILRQVHWGAAWLEVMIRRGEAVESVKLNDRLQTVLDLVTSAVEHERLHESGMACVTRMATNLDCDRVSLGLMKGKHIRVDILSHSADFGKQTNLVRAIGAAMDEAADQQATVVYPAPPGAPSLILRAHEELARQHASGTVLTVLLTKGERIQGALTLERRADRPFDEETVKAYETAAALVGPILEAKRSEERWLIRKAWDSSTAQLERVIGPGHLIAKLVAIALLFLVLFFAFFKVDYRVTAPTVIEGSIQRVVAAPFDGYIKETPVRPGDVVEEGALLCLLDDRDLELERLKWATEKGQYAMEYQQAMAKHDRAQIRILRAKIGQAEAQIHLIDEQLARTRVVAPFRGIIMSGDLSQSLGAPVERGRELFKIAPLDEYRVISEVDERDILEIEAGQHCELVLPSMPGDPFSFIVKKVTPVSSAKEGRNYFRVEGEMEESSDRLRPGMEGVGKITVDRRLLIWVWTHEAFDWLRLQAWKWLPSRSESERSTRW